MSTRRIASLALVWLFAAASGGTAFGQAMGASPGPFAPYDAPPARGAAAGQVDGEGAARMLRGRGFTNVSVVRRRGPTIILEANGPRGERVQVVVDSNSGAISGMKVIGYGDQRY
ncbi:hypothetical protein [Ancylobacter pratisalsi]|uniref:hypothetical protein n=1 Tax=Ancylobacter pratisalsi TaxID=1745854 RepID=UPI001FE24BE9|nr:hypothetical protein [Ancylobacter pratisalsi]